jgi:ubiquitin-protein ligase E3 C
MGIDGGGLFKEFMTDLLKEVFDSDRGLWLTNKKNELYPNHSLYATERKQIFLRCDIFRSSTHGREAHSLNWYRFIGRILGKALYENILVDVAFAGFFLAKVRLCDLVASLSDSNGPLNCSGSESRVSLMTLPLSTRNCTRV